MIEAELKEAQNKAHENHSQEMKMLIDKAAALQASAAKMAQEHQEEEDVLRKKKCKTAAEVASVVEKYDAEMLAMEEEMRGLASAFKHEQEQCMELHEHFIKVGTWLVLWSGRDRAALLEIVADFGCGGLDAAADNRSTRSSRASTRRRRCSRRSALASARSSRWVGWMTVFSYCTPHQPARRLWHPTGFSPSARLPCCSQYVFDAATRIQKVYRGVLARREFAKMLAKTKKGKKGGGGKKGGKKK